MPSSCRPNEPLPSFLHIICRMTELIPLLKQRQLAAQQLARSSVLRQPAAPMTLTELAMKGGGFYQLPRKRKSIVIGPIGRPDGIGFGELPAACIAATAVSPAGEWLQGRFQALPQILRHTVGLVCVACRVV